MTKFSMASTTPPSILLVHGAWHGPWCWKYQIPALEAQGYSDIHTVDLPCVSGVAGKTQYDDAAHVSAAIEKLADAGKRVVVVAHSYGGPIGSAAVRGLSERERSRAGAPGGVVGLIVLVGYLFPGGMDQGAIIDEMGGLPYVTMDSPSEGLFVPKDARALFFPPGTDVSDEHADWALGQLRPQSMAANRGIVPPQAWQEDELAGRLGYIRCTADTLITAEAQDQMLESVGGQAKWIIKSIEGASHSPFLSRPQDTATTIDGIIKEFGKSG